MINWVMVHVANSPSRPQRDGSDMTDRPAITGSCETELGLLPTVSNSLTLSFFFFFFFSLTITSRQKAAAAQREEACREGACKV